MAARSGEFGDRQRIDTSQKMASRASSDSICGSSSSPPPPPTATATPAPTSTYSHLDPLPRIVASPQPNTCDQ
ncbi:hypothetical protein BDV93DRAFT_560809 [Ceratobasidium sp. AG-I]|nr:hypothetical protein BDV93DRAFT_560809 [Ceratobasidium sp. AG-I]